MTKTEARRETTKTLKAGNRIEKLAWRRLLEIHEKTNRPTVRRMIEKEARCCGYDLAGLRG